MTPNDPEARLSACMKEGKSFILITEGDEDPKQAHILTNVVENNIQLVANLIASAVVGLPGFVLQAEKNKNES